MALARREQRTIEAYSLHGRVGTEIIDYQNLFAAITVIPLAQRQVEVGTQVVGVTIIDRIKFGFVMRMIAGTPGVSAIFYDTLTGEESVEDFGSRVVARSIWVVVNPTKRLVAVERKRPGVGIDVIERALEILGSIAGIGQNLRIDLNPVPTQSFLAEVDQLDRIREAAVVLHRPNYDWTDNIDDLSGYGDESGADRVEVQLNARRGETLHKNSGILLDIRRLVAKGISAIKDVRVVGTRYGESKERSVRLKNHLERTFITVPPDADERSALVSASVEMIERIVQQPETDSENEITKRE